MSERGSVTILVVTIVTLTVLLGTAVASVGVLIAARTRAVSAADAAALAAAPLTFPLTGEESPVEEAARYAELNGARLVSCVCPRDPSLRARVVTVVVEVGPEVPLFGLVPVRMASSAEFDPMVWLMPAQ